MRGGLEKLCVHFGLGEKERAERLELVGLNPADRELARELNGYIEGRLDAIVDDFYRHLGQHRRYSEFLTSTEVAERLRRTMRHYLATLGIDFEHEDYFESRLRIGVVHRRIELPLSLYETAYRLLQQLILDSLPEHELRRLGGFLLRITALDMMLAIETYHRSSVEDLAGTINELKGREGEMRELANRDALTGAASRRHALELLAGALEDRRAVRQMAAVLLVDIDHFKKVNDNHGHLVGDEVLRQVVRRLTGALREGDVIGRYGGEEFVVMVSGNDGLRYRDIGHRLVSDMNASEIRIRSRGLAIPITVSVGGTLARAGQSVEDVLERADRALYAAKSTGRNRMCAAEDLPAD